MHIAIREHALKLKGDKLLPLLLRNCVFFHAENIDVIDKFYLQKILNYERGS